MLNIVKFNLTDLHEYGVSAVWIFQFCDFNISTNLIKRSNEAIHFNGRILNKNLFIIKRISEAIYSLLLQFLNNLISYTY